MKLEKLNKELNEQLQKNIKQIMDILDFEFGNEKDFTISETKIKLTFTVDGEERGLELDTPFETEE